MGNNQSNERQQPNYKIFEITHVDNDKDKKYIKVWLHDYVTYIDGNYKHVYLEKHWPDYLLKPDYKEGNYLAIDLNATSREGSGHDFDQIIGPVKKLGKNQVIEERDTDGRFIKFVCTTGEFLGELVESRERYQAAIMESRGSNYARFRQTSYDMPPKW